MMAVGASDDFQYGLLAQERHEIRLFKILTPSPSENVESALLCIDMDHYNLGQCETVTCKLCNAREGLNGQGWRAGTTPETSMSPGSSMAAVDVKSPLYAALSYTWGPKQPSFDIIINGRRFTIRKNLYQWLINVRRLGRFDALFWADQLCINQDDIPERNSQVKMMSAIYTAADQVHIWLGAGIENIHLGFGLMQEFIRFSTEHNSKNIRHLRNLIRSNLWNSKSPKERQAVLRMLTQPYWTRVWIVQEILLARNLVFSCEEGLYSLPDWNIPGPITPYDLITHCLLQDVYSYTGQDKNSQLQLCDLAMRALDLLTDASKEWKLTESHKGGLQHFDSTSRECQDPRDHVYGYQACLQEQHRVQIDYTKSTEQVFVDVLSAYAGSESANLDTMLSSASSSTWLWHLRQKMELEPMNQQAVTQLLEDAYRARASAENVCIYYTWKIYESSRSNLEKLRQEGYLELRKSSPLFGELEAVLFSEKDVLLGSIKFDALSREYISL